MTEEQIFELAKTCEFDEFPDDITATKEQLLKFAQAIYEKGREGGYNDGVDTMMKMTDAEQNDPL